MIKTVSNIVVVGTPRAEHVKLLTYEYAPLAWNAGYNFRGGGRPSNGETNTVQKAPGVNII